MRLLQNPVAADVSPLHYPSSERQSGLTSAATGLRNAPASWTAAALCRLGRAESAGGPAHSKTWRTTRRDSGRIPTGFRHSVQGCEARATLGQASETDATLKGLCPPPPAKRHNPVGVEILWGTLTQGSRSAPTLGWRTQSRWDCWRALPSRPRRGRTRIAVGETRGYSPPVPLGRQACVAQVSKPAVSPTSKSAACESAEGLRVWKPATQQTWKSALRTREAIRTSNFTS
jgi:hypothetical protein